MMNEQQTAIAKQMIADRAMRLVTNGLGDLPSSRNELAGLLAGFAEGVLKDITPECIDGFIAGGHADEYMGVKLVSGERTRKPKAAKPTTTVLENSHVRVECDVNVDGKVIRINGDDKRDKFNLPRFFTTNKRGLDKQWAALVGVFSDETTYRGAIGGLSAAGAKVHDYCSMD